MNLEEKIREAEANLAELRRVYLASLAETDRVNQVAFLLYQRDVKAEPDWEGEVTWEHWHELMIDSERDEYRLAAVELIRILAQPDETELKRVGG